MISMPRRLVGGVNYTIRVYSRMVALEVPVHSREFTWRLVTSNINGSDTVLTLEPGNITIENIDNVIYLS